MNRQRLILSVLLGVLLLAVGYSVIRFPRQKTVEKQGAAPRVKPVTPEKNGSAGDETRVRLELLQKSQVRFTGFKKNIFAPIFRDISKLPPVKPVIPMPPPPPAPPVVTQPTVSPLEREMAQFTFLGFLEKERQKTIFLAKNKEIFLVKKGERLAGKYEATAITEDALTIRMLDGDPTEIIIPLMENQSLKAPPQQQNGAAGQPQPVAGRASRRPGRAAPAPESRPSDE